jgi:hypothetical protein
MLRLREGRLDAAQCRLALSAIEEAVARAPHNPRRRLDLALALEAASARPDLASEADDLRRRAASAYQETGAIDDRLRLDPLAQLSGRERAQVAASLERLRARGAG